MAFIDKEDIQGLLEESKTQAHLWREDYQQYERLMDNGLMEGLDPNLPEVNDGSLSAALFKLPKRVYDDNLTGSVSVMAVEPADDNTTPEPVPAWLPILANIEWRNHIIPNANTQAPFDWKWKAAIRKAAGYGSVPIITLSVHRDGKNYTDFIVAQPQDVVLEAGKVSDYDSDVEFWDVYFSKLQFKSMIEQAKEEMKSKDSSNKWDVPAMETILKGDFKEEREAQDSPLTEEQKKQRTSGFKFTIIVQRGVNAPFYMHHGPTDVDIRTWDNPDPTGDTCIHFLYCYQDLINPYGIGICKLAGGTQNVLDYMRQADILATQLGLRPPIMVQGDADQVDFDSLIYAQDAPWIVGNAKVERMELSNAVYNALPQRIQMYQASLQKLIPTGDTSLSASNTGDSTQSKTPAGVKLAAANLSIDDEDFKDNFLATYSAVANSMLNTHFANMEGKDMRTVSDDERDMLMKAGLQFPQNPDGTYTNELEIVWDTVRGKYRFTVDPTQDKAQEDADKLKGLDGVLQLVSNPETQALLANSKPIIIGNKKLDVGELIGDIIGLTSDNDKIITDITQEDEQNLEQAQQVAADQGKEQPKTIGESIAWKPADLTDNERAQALAQGGIQADPAGTPTPADAQAQLDANHQNDELALKAHAQQHSQTMAETGAAQSAKQADMSHQEKLATASSKPEASSLPKKPKAPKQDATVQANIEAVMNHYGVDQPTALKALAAEHAGLPIEDIIGKLKQGAV